jgi:hypothetical protein
MSDFAQIRFQPNRPLLRELSADRLNTILQEIKRNKPKGERGITVRQDGTGTYIGLAASLPRGNGTSTPTTRQPWDLIARVDPDSSDPENPDYLVTVNPGTMLGFLATNWDEEFTLASGTLYYAKAVVSLPEGQVVDTVTIVIDDQPAAAQTPQPFGFDTSVEVLFGLFKDGQSNNVLFQPRPRTWLIAEKDSPAEPGESPYSIYGYLA